MWSVRGGSTANRCIVGLIHQRPLDCAPEVRKKATASTGQGPGARMREPSPQLKRRLLENHLCTPADLRRCRSLSRLLSRDLPAFDTVWIDALLQRRCITRFQADILQSGAPDRIRAGRCVFVDRIGGGRRSETFLARHAQGKKQCALKRIHAVDMPAAGAIDVLRNVIASVGRNPELNPAVVVPHRCHNQSDSLLLVSRFVQGHTLRELLVRRGRFSPELVFATGRQLLAGLAWLEQLGAVHGDIRMSNVRLRPDGQFTLVDAVIRPVLFPDFSFHDCSRPDDCSGIAPERQLPGHRADASSDLYALGCLLWEVLTGRPPHPSADLARRLTAHATESIVNPREWAPDCPQQLADTIHGFVNRDPARRPASYREAAESWPDSTRRSPRRIGRRFATEFRSSVRVVPRNDRRIRRFALAACAVVAAVAAGSVFVNSRYFGDVPLLEIGQTAELKQRGELNTIGDPQTAHGLQPAAGPARHTSRLASLPEPDRTGRIRLSGGPFDATDISVAGPLSVVAAPGQHPVIIVGRKTWQLSAESVVLENLTVFTRSAISRPDSAGIVRTVCQNLEIRRSVIAVLSDTSSGDALSGATSAVRETALAWQPDDSGDHSGRRIHVEHTTFLGTQVAVRFHSAPALVRCRNVLAVVGDAAFECLNAPRSGQTVRIQTRDVTLRRAHSVLKVHPGDENLSEAGSFILRPHNCVFAVDDDRGSLVRLVDGDIRRLQPLVRSPRSDAGSGSERAEISLLTRNVPDCLHDSRLRHPASTDSLVRIDGIVHSPLTFRGEPDLDPHMSQLIDFELSAPRRLAVQPGIDPDRIPNTQQTISKDVWSLIRQIAVIR